MTQTLSMDPRIGQRRVDVARSRRRRRRRWWVAAGVGAAAVVGAVAALHSPLLSARHVTVHGAPAWSDAAVVRAAGLDGNPPLIDVSPAAVSSRVEALPWVGTAAVRRMWPDSVVITVTDRTPVAAVARPGGYALVDRTGRVLAWVSTPPPGLVAMSIPATVGAPGSTLGSVAHPALQVASTVPTQLVGVVERVTGDALGHVQLELAGGLVADLGGVDQLGAKWESLASVLAGAHPRDPAVIDVSVPGDPTVGPPGSGLSWP